MPPPERPTSTTDHAADLSPAPGDLGLVVSGTRLLTTPDGGLPRVGELPAETGWVPLGTLDGVPTWATETADPSRAATQRAGGRWRSWRALAAELPEPVATLAGRAVAVVTWRRTHRWCGACRAALADVPGQTARRCPDCGLYVPLRLSPAVLAAITRPGRSGGPTELLLVRHASGPTELWALVAGFVEAGESLETAVRREVTEEVSAGPRTTVDYFGSQPWAISRAGGAARRLHRHRRRPATPSRWWTGRSWPRARLVPGGRAAGGAAAGVLDLAAADRRRRLARG